MGLFGNIRNNINETRRLEAVKEETKRRYIEHYRRYEMELNNLIDKTIKEWVVKANQKVSVSDYKKYNVIEKQLINYYQEIGKNGFEEGALDPRGDQKKLWDGEFKIKLYLQNTGMSNEGIEEYVRVAVKVYFACNEFGEDRELPMNIEFRRR